MKLIAFLNKLSSFFPQRLSEKGVLEQKLYLPTKIIGALCEENMLTIYSLNPLIAHRSGDNRAAAKHGFNNLGNDAAES